MSLTRLSYDELKEFAKEVDRHTKKYNLPTAPKKKKKPKADK